MKKDSIEINEKKVNSYCEPTITYIGADSFIIPAVGAAVVGAAKAVAATSAVKAVGLALVTGAAAGATGAVVSKAMS